jgi:hypothetical protein
MATTNFGQLAIAPLGAGDLIDRAIRLYRQHFFVFIRIATPPVIVVAIGSVLTSVGARHMVATSDTLSLAGAILMLLAGVCVSLIGYLFSVIVMGGASRNLVTHLLRNEPVSARATYAAVKSRFWSLLGASVLVMLWVIITASVTFFAWYLASITFGIVAIAMAQVAPVGLLVTMIIIVVLGVGLIAAWFFFFLFGRIVYVPQAIMVEGKGVFAAVGRSFSLAKGNVRRLMAMFMFTVFAFYGALAILVIPLYAYGWLSGVELSPINQSEWPVWFAIGNAVITETIHILLAPVWMLGLSLLYVDERVRHEGYDIELMAARQLPEMPKTNVASPLAPALALEIANAPPPPRPAGGVLGLH